MKTICLTRGEKAIVDDADFESLSAYKWYVMVRPGCKHAARTINRNGHRSHVYMHRQVLGARHGQLVDHANRNGLDNRRENLRMCSKAENAWNGNRNIKGKTSKFKGVCLKANRRERSPWLSTITINGKQKYVGTFKTEIEAAKAYDAAAVKFFGEFAATNFNRRENV